MDGSTGVYLRKAEESLEGANSEFVNGRYNNAVNRCYYACFQAAVDIEDTDLVTDLVIDRLLNLQVEEQLPLYFIIPHADEHPVEHMNARRIPWPRVESALVPSAAG